MRVFANSVKEVEVQSLIDLKKVRWDMIPYK